MSKYTTELRYICENIAGYTESQGLSNVDDIIDKAREKIFDFDYEFDEEYKPVLEHKILKHYYMYEINAETYAQWLLQFQFTIQELAPFYNVLHSYYKENAERLFDSISYTETSSKDGTEAKTGSGSSSSTGTNKGSSTSTGNGTEKTTESGSNSETVNDSVSANGHNNKKEEGTDTYTKWDYQNDTPQGGLADLESLKYLSKATKDTNNEHTSGNTYYEYTDKSTDETKTNGSNKNDSNTTTTDSNKSSHDNTTSNQKDTTNKEDIKTTEEYLKKLSGKKTNSSYLEEINKLTKQFVNVDVEFINALRNNFMLLW